MAICGTYMKRKMSLKVTFAPGLVLAAERGAAAKPRGEPEGGEEQVADAGLKARDVVIGKPLTLEQVRNDHSIALVLADRTTETQLFGPDLNRDMDQRDVLLCDGSDESVAAERVLDELEERGFADARRARKNGEVGAEL